MASEVAAACHKKMSMLHLSFKTFKNKTLSIQDYTNARSFVFHS